MTAPRVLVRSRALGRLQIMLAQTLALISGFVFALDVPVLRWGGVMAICVSIITAMKGGNASRVGLASSSRSLTLRGAMWESRLEWAEVTRLLVRAGGGSVLVNWRGKWKTLTMAFQGEPLWDSRALAAELERLCEGTEFAGSVEVARGVVPDLPARLRMHTTDIAAMPLRIVMPGPRAWLWMTVALVIAVASEVAASSVLV